MSRLARLRGRVAPLVPALRIAGFVAAIGIVVYVAVRAAGTVRLQELAWWPLPGAFAGAVVWWLLLARGWAVLATGRARAADVSAWCRTQALRYLPGGFWAPASRTTLVQGGWLEKLWTVGAENIGALCAALAVGGAALAVAGEPAWAPLVALVAAPPLAARALARRTNVAPARVGRATRTYVLAFAVYALAAVLAQVAVSGWEAPLAVAGAACVAWGAGLVVIVAPSGVGVREAAYVGLLAHQLPTGELAAAAVAMRLVMVLAELAVLLAVGRPGSSSTRGALRGEAAG